MLIKMMKGKIHRAVVTHSDLHYEGSVGVDESLLELSAILNGEAVHVWNVNNGERFETYALPLPRGSGQVCVNGAAARLAQPGDLIIITSFRWIDEASRERFTPQIVFVDSDNRAQRQAAT
jgi:aspartate 1-decarboxylase